METFYKYKRKDISICYNRYFPFLNIKGHTYFFKEKNNLKKKDIHEVLSRAEQDIEKNNIGKRLLIKNIGMAFDKFINSFSN